MVSLAASELDKRATHFLMTSGIVPRPIAWVGTLDLDGNKNLAPFSYYMGVSASPPRIAFSVARGRKGALKDTACNVLSNRVFSVSLVSRPLAAAMAKTAKPLAPDIDEFAVAGLSAADCTEIAAPFVADSPFVMECVVEQALDLDSTHLVIGRVVRFHMADEAWKDGKLDIERIEAVGRLGVESGGAGQYVPVELARVFSL